MLEKDRNYPNAGDVAEGPKTVGGAGRQSAKSLLLEHAERLRREAHQLEALAYQCDRIHGEAEMMLYRLLSGSVHR